MTGKLRLHLLRATAPTLAGLLLCSSFAAHAQGPNTAQASPASQAPDHTSQTVRALDLEGKPKRQLALFRTASLSPKLQELGAALDPVVLSELQTVPSIEIAARPSLDLPAMQLAIDCVGEVTECMAAVSREAGVEGLVAPVLRSDGDQVLVTLLHYDVALNELKGVTRALTGRSVAQAMMDAVPEMVREAFSLAPEPAPVPTEPHAVAPAQSADTQSEAQGQRPLVRLLPFVLGGAGVALIGVGLGLGISSQHLEDVYKKTNIDSRADVNRALDTLDKAERRALSANILFGVGGAAIASGIVTWLLLRPKAEASDSNQASLKFAPAITTSQVGLSLSGVLR